MIKLCQSGPRWAIIKMGKTEVTVGRMGCLLTDLSMLSDYFGDFKTPDELAKKLLFTADARIIWDSLVKVLPFTLEKRVYNLNHFEIDVSLKDPRKAVVLNVNSGAHWVTAIRKSTLFPNHYVVIDPWDGKEKTTRAFRNISGSAHFIKK